MQGSGIFEFAFGFARIEVTIITASGNRLELTTKEITCLTRHTNTELVISGMLRALLDKSDDEAMRWMVSGVEANGVPAALGTDSSLSNGLRSLYDLVQSAELVTHVYEKHLGFFADTRTA